MALFDKAKVTGSVTIPGAIIVAVVVLVLVALVLVVKL